MASPAYLTVKQFADSIGIGERRAREALRRCHDGGQWRGWALNVVTNHSRGGASGLSYLVRVDSLPPELSLSAKAMFVNGTDDGNSAPLALPAPATGTALAVQNQMPISLPAISASTAASKREWEWKWELIRRAAALPEGSSARADMIRQLAAEPVRVPGGARRQVGESTIRAWLRAYAEKGLAGLCRKPRSDRGNDRVMISRTWDDGVSLSDEVKAEIVAKLITRVKSAWAEAGGGKGKGAAKGGGGWKVCCRLATTRLIELTRAAGLDLPTQQLLALCEVPRGFVESHRNYAIIALKNKDAKAFFDTAAPRTRRTRDRMVPMELVVGDVHHLDIYKRRDDGSLHTPKLIGWLDVATNRMFITLVFVEKGRMIRQEDITASFIEMTQHPEWGMPQALYLDNGGEYSKLGFVDDAMKLATLAQCQDFRVECSTDARRKMVIHAQPYNAPAKPIEGIFAVLEGGAFAMVPGWIGGNRMKAKTKNVGSEPSVFIGTEDEFRQIIATAMDYFHTNIQGGSLKGKTPREAITTAVMAGWKRTDIDPMALHAVFAKEVTREVTQGELSYNGTTFRATELLGLLPGTKVRVRIPIVGDKNALPVMDENGRFLCIAEPAPRYDFLDPAGATDRGRRISAQNEAIRAMTREIEPLDLVAEMGAAAALHPPAPIPQSGGTIRLSDDMEAISQAAKQLPATRAQALDAQTQARLAQRAAMTKLLAAG